MKPHEFPVSGRVNSKGQLLILNQEKMNDFFKLWPNTMATLTVTVHPKGSNRSQLGYYWKRIIPDMQKGYRKLGDRYSVEQTDLEVRRLSPVCQRMEGNMEIVVAVSALSMNEMSDHIEFCLQMAAQDLNIRIENPKLV